MHDQMDEPSSRKMFLKVMDDPSPAAFALMLTANCHLTNSGFGRRKRCGDNTGDKISALVKQAKVQLAPFLGEIFIVKGEPDRYAQYLIAKLALLPEIVGSKLYVSERHWAAPSVSILWCAPGMGAL